MVHPPKEPGDAGEADRSGDQSPEEEPGKEAPLPDDDGDGPASVGEASVTPDASDGSAGDATQRIPETAGKDRQTPATDSPAPGGEGACHDLRAGGDKPIRFCPHSFPGNPNVFG